MPRDRSHGYQADRQQLKDVLAEVELLTAGFGPPRGPEPRLLRRAIDEVAGTATLAELAEGVELHDGGKVTRTRLVDPLRYEIYKLTHYRMLWPSEVPW